MSSKERLPSYPLEAVRERERWALEALQLRLATASVECRKLAEGHRRLIDAVGSAVATATMTSGSIIDPAGADRRLRAVELMQVAAAAAARAVALGEALRQGLRLAVDAQRIRLESIERHRQAFADQTARDAARLQGIEAERAWLARSAWQARSESGSGGSSAAPSNPPGGRRP